MNLVRYNPNNRLRSGTNMGSRIFDDLFSDFFSPLNMTGKPAGMQEGLALKVDIYERDKTIVINAELPGVAKEDISVDIKGKLVTLGGERKNDEEINEENCYRRERRYGKFERTFNLPFEVNGDSVKATYDNGILKLEIPKPEEQVAKKITIN
ncbi:MAG: Hsp20 family protein [Desulforhopalus sp.]|nr:Hsp20 family protein [Desulforhopalus sp.]